MPETLSSPAAASPIKGYQHRNRYFASFSLCHQRIQVVFPLHWFRVEAAQSKRNFPCKPLRQCRHPLEGFNKPGRNQSEAIFHSCGGRTHTDRFSCYKRWDYRCPDHRLLAIGYSRSVGYWLFVTLWFDRDEQNTI
jgi:hypothetical protein